MKAQEILQGCIRKMEEKRAGIKNLILTGYQGIDDILITLKESNLYIISGHEHSGKSSLAMGIALNVSFEHDVLYWSFQHPRDQLYDRLLNYIGHEKAKDVLEQSKLRVIDSQFNFGLPQDFEFVTQIVEANFDHSPKLIVFDCLQSLHCSGSKIAQTRKIIRFLKNLAKKFNVAVLAVSSTHCDQKNWEANHFQIYDVDPSESIMNDSDAVILLYREEIFAPTPSNKGIVDVSIVKYRHGPRGATKLLFEPECNRLSSINKNLDT